ncbi:MAG: hypothetical protein COV36_01555 [Alphaproteobacteria bacterium CG11_big_fil_rev_8_21_14_0_20_44_7]|nr:MAG: hypothetical protein COV36_01555 [Alphaproteobacteria bacterium CG11_big_fil_rev_8_21_14_0_20_44_7]
MIAHTKNRQNTLRAKLTIFTLFVSFAMASHSLDTEVGASATFVKALSITGNSDMSFGVIQYTSNNAANEITLSPDGAISCTNNSDYICPPSGARGEVKFSGSAGFELEISCEASGAISNGSEIFQLDAAAINIGESTYNCLGTGSSAAQYTLTGDVESDALYLGSRLNIPETGISEGGEYASDYSGGDPITIRIVYQ